MQITSKSELMKNQKHALVMAPDKAFEVLQTSDGDSLFFSIGTDDVLYVTREVRSTEIGWDKIDLSSQASKVANARVKAKSFAVSQQADTLAVDLALVVTDGVQDTLYLSLGNPNKADSWGNPIIWTLVPFDADVDTRPSRLVIADVYLTGVSISERSTVPINCFVDILRDPSDPMKLLDRFYIQPKAARKWGLHALPIDLREDSIISCLGHRQSDGTVPGIYTFGLIEKTTELIYVPQYYKFRVGFPPPVSRLGLPDGATSAASSFNQSGNSVLFVAAHDGIYYFAADNQRDGASPELIITATWVGPQNLLANLTSLSASTVGNRTYIWGINAQRELVNMYCQSGSEAHPESWSCPVPLTGGVEGYAFYLNSQAATNVLFAHTSGQELDRFFQSPETRYWDSQKIMLPAADMDDMLETNTFTTQVNVVDNDGLPMKDVQLGILSDSQIKVLVNNIYEVLTPVYPVFARTNAQGNMTIIQETDTLSGVSYTISADGPPAISVEVDVMAKLLETLDGVQSGDDLSQVYIGTANGKEKPLVPDDVSDNDREAAAQAIRQMLGVKDDIAMTNLMNEKIKEAPRNATSAQWQSLRDTYYAARHKKDKASNNGVPTGKVPGKRSRGSNGKRNEKAKNKTSNHCTPLNRPTKNAWGMSFNDGCCRYHEDDEALQLNQPTQQSEFQRGNNPRRHANGHTLPQRQDPDFSNGLSSYYLVNGADGFNGQTADGAFLESNTSNDDSPPLKTVRIGFPEIWSLIKHAAEELSHFVVQKLADGWNFICKIGDVLYEAILDSVAAVVHGIQFVLSKIKVLFEDLVAWLGFLFEWDDILRTQKVVENLIRMSITKSINSVASAEVDVRRAFSGLISQIDKWAGIAEDNPTKPIGDTTRAVAASADGSKADSPQANWGTYHMNNGASSAEVSEDLNSIPSGVKVDEALDGASSALTDSSDTLGTMSHQLTEIFQNGLTGLSPSDILKRFAAILADGALNLICDSVVATMELFKLLADGLLKLIDTPIQIPILSRLYYDLTKENLTILSLLGLVGGIAATVTIKLVTQRAPYPDDSNTAQLSETRDPDVFFPLFFGQESRSLQIKDSRKRNGLSRVQAQTSAKAWGSSICLIAADVGSCLAIFYVLSGDWPKGALGHGGFALVTFALFTAPGYMSWYNVHENGANDSWPDLFSGIAIMMVICRQTMDGAVKGYGRATGFEETEAAFKMKWTGVLSALDCVIGVLFTASVGGKIDAHLKSNNATEASDVLGWLVTFFQIGANLASFPMIFGSAVPQVKVAKITCFGLRAVAASLGASAMLLNH